MSDGSSDVSTQWNNLLATIDITLQTTRSETGQSDSSNVSAQWNSLLANIDTPGVVAQTEAKDIPETTSDVSLSTSPQPTQNASEDEYHPSPVPSPVLFNQTGPSSSETRMEMFNTLWVSEKYESGPEPFLIKCCRPSFCRSFVLESCCRESAHPDPWSVH